MMKTTWLVNTLVVLSAHTLVDAADCTPAELAQVTAAQQDPGVLAACASYVKDSNKPITLTNLDFCKSPSCLDTIKAVIADLPDCVMNGVSIKAGTSGLSATCTTGGVPPPRPPPGPGGLPPPGPGGLPPTGPGDFPPPGPNGLPPPGPNGLPPPGPNGLSPPGPNGLPPPGPGGLPPPGSSKPPLTSTPEPTQEVTATILVSDTGNTPMTPTPTSVKPVATNTTSFTAGNSSATVKPAETDEEEAGNPTAGSKDSTDDTSITTPKEVEMSTPNPKTITPPPSKSTSSRIVLPTLLSVVVVGLAFVLV